MSESKKKRYNWDGALKWEAEAEDSIELQQDTAGERKIDHFNIKTEIEIKKEEILEFNIDIFNIKTEIEIKEEKVLEFYIEPVSEDSLIKIKEEQETLVIKKEPACDDPLTVEHVKIKDEVVSDNESISNNSEWEDE
jgi:hypothetical protein